MSIRPPALDPTTLNVRRGSGYPAPFRAPCEERIKRVLGDVLGLTQFGVNLVELAPSAWSAQRHWHSREDEFVYVLEGDITLVTGDGEQVLGPGTAAGFPAGKEDGHHLVNRTNRVAIYLEIGTRDPGDEAHYPDIDLKLERTQEGRRFTDKAGEPY